MPDKISVYVDREIHRSLKAEASLRGKSLSEFMVDAALNALHAPHRQASATKMDRIRSSVKGKITAEELQSMRNEGRQ
jgi:uncharacterized protein (DUF1778 family)